MRNDLKGQCKTNNLLIKLYDSMESCDQLVT